MRLAAIALAALVLAASAQNATAYVNPFDDQSAYDTVPARYPHAFVVDIVCVGERPLPPPEIKERVWCGVRFNTRRRGCWVRTEPDAAGQLQVVGPHVCRKRKWRVPTIAYEDFVNGVDVRVGR